MSAHSASARSHRGRWLAAAAASAAALVAFAVLRPDTLVLDRRVDEELPVSVQEALGLPAATTRPGDGTPADQATALQPARVLGAGEFYGQAGHRAEGRASLLSAPEGRLVVLADLDVQNGPDLRVYLSPTGDGAVEGGIDLGPLKGNQGTQIYPVPQDSSLAGQTHVVVWCERFATPFGSAPLG